MSFFRRLFKTRGRKHIDFHEVFMDVENLPGFNTQQFEGVLERPISKKIFIGLGVLVGLVFALFAIRLVIVQIKDGKSFFAISENNRLDSIPVFTERGVIFDRNGTELAWNVPSPTDEPFFHRAYYTDPGFAHVLGYVEYPKKDNKGIYWRTELAGKSGVEKLLNARLQGQNGAKLVETDATGTQKSESTVIAPVPGENVTLTIDAGVQASLYGAIRELAESMRFTGGAGIIMDITNGEIIAITSYPEFEPNIMAEGTDTAVIKNYFSDAQKPFLNRALSGLYTPGSIVKPYLALAALQEGLVTPQTTVNSIGYISIPNPYNPDQPTIFRDHKKEGHGITNLNHAIAESVNTYFYSIGGGYQGQPGLGISRIDKYISLFDIGEKTGIDMEGEVAGLVPSPEWKKKTFKDGTWRLGDTYNTSIGQYGFQVTPIQMVRAVAAIANSGTLVTPHVVQGEKNISDKKITEINAQYFSDVRTAMRETVVKGTAMRMNVPYISSGAKTGTAQVGKNNEFENAWITGFFPYEQPRYAFAVVMERGPDTNETGASFVMRQVFDWMYQNKWPYLFGEEQP